MTTERVHCSPFSERI